jgi:hypothetical protein
MNTLALKGIAAVFALEAQIKDLPQVECQIRHLFIEGVCVRVAHIPSDTVLTGMIHNKENVSILAKGSMLIFDGSNSKTVEAGHIQIDPPGIKRAGATLTDCVFINVFRTDTTDEGALLSELGSSSVEEYEQKLLGDII